MAMKAGALAAAAFVLLVPTFNALNAANFEATEPPFKIKPPTPPDEFPEFDPPPGDEEFEGELEGDSEGPMPMGCEPDPDRYRSDQEYSQRVPAGFAVFGSSAAGPAPIRVEPFALRILVIVNFTNYQGGLDVTLASPDGNDGFDESASSFTDPRIKNTSQTEPPWNRAQESPAAGEWHFNWRAQPNAGSANLDVVVLYPVCQEPVPDGADDEGARRS